LRVELHKDRWATQYNPQRLRGVAVYEAAVRTFAKGDRVQLTAPDRANGLANRELGEIQRIDASGNVSVKTDSGRTATFSDEYKHLDHGYAVTSHSAQGTTADRVIVHAESSQSPALVNERFAYMAVSRARDDLQVYTDDAHRLGTALDRPFDKTAAHEQQTDTAAPGGKGFEHHGQAHAQMESQASKQGQGQHDLSQSP
jgi:ATP-dependent exoDNAse (exonuclease V) alpha subunit